MKKNNEVVNNSVEFKGIITIISSFLVMLCLGGIYTWSIFAVELTKASNFNYSYSQLVFGLLIAVFTISMTYGKKLLNFLKPSLIVTISGILFFAGYFITYLSKGNIILIFTGISIFAGIATGLGYLVSISIPVLWFPLKKGLVLGIISGGFGAGSILLSYLSSYLFKTYDVFQTFLIIGILYGCIIILFSLLVKKPNLNKDENINQVQSINIKLLKDINFKKLFFSIFTGTFAGLMVIGNLKLIGLQYNITNEILVLSVALFSFANFLGRITWGWLNDFVEGKILIPMSLFLIGLFTLLIGNIKLSDYLFVIISILTGFSFGANFVIYARETAHIYGVNNIGYIYPYVFLGYGISGIFGPVLGGALYDTTGNFKLSALISFGICMIMAILNIILNRKLNCKSSS